MKKFSIYLLMTLLFSMLNLTSGIAQNHKVYASLLQKHVSENGLVNYKGFINDKPQLNEYLNSLSEHPPKPSWSDKQKMSYWINVYNAFTIKLIVDHYPVKSILSINEGKPWDLSFIPIGDKMYTLNQVENDILRKDFDEPRIHFAINCASISCPKLLNRPFDAALLPTQLNKVSKEFVQNTDKNMVTAKLLKISKIFDWFKGDFESSGGVIGFLNTYAEVKIVPSPKIMYMDYNWNLNQQ